MEKTNTFIFDIKYVIITGRVLFRGIKSFKSRNEEKAGNIETLASFCTSKFNGKTFKLHQYKFKKEFLDNNIGVKENE